MKATYLALVVPLLACGKTKAPSDDKACEILLAAGISESKEDCPKALKEAKKLTGDNYGAAMNCLSDADGKQAAATCIMKYADTKALQKGLEDYQTKSKSIEAAMMVRRIGSGVRMFWEFGDPSAPIGLDPATQAKELPASVGPTPAKGACCSDGADKCAPDPAQWTGTWKLLEVEVLDPHYYSYEYTRGDDGKSFTASAYGDLDCDGTFSTFRLRGSVGADGEIVLGEVEKENELE